MKDISEYTRMGSGLILCMIVFHMFTACNNPGFYSFYATNNPHLRFEKKFTLEGRVVKGGVFNVKTRDGDIVVTDSRSHDSKCQLNIRVVAHSADKAISQDLADKVKVALVQKKERTKVQIHRPKLMNNQFIAVHIDAFIPEYLDVIAQTEDGDISLTGQAKAISERFIRLSTMDGSISAENVRGKLHTKTDDGNIDLKTISGIIRVITNDGDTTAENIKGDFTASSDDGDISIKGAESDKDYTYHITSMDGKVMADTLKGKITIGTNDGRIILKNFSGDSTLTTTDGFIFSENIAGDFSARSDDGDIRLIGATGEKPFRYEIHSMDGDITASNLNGKINISTNDGNIDIAHINGQVILTTDNGEIKTSSVKGDIQVKK